MATRGQRARKRRARDKARRRHWLRGRRCVGELRDGRRCRRTPLPEAADRYCAEHAYQARIPENEHECAVCLEVCRRAEALPCGHLVHDACFAQCARSECPVCRRPSAATHASCGEGFPIVDDDDDDDDDVPPSPTARLLFEGRHWPTPVIVLPPPPHIDIASDLRSSVEFRWRFGADRAEADRATWRRIQIIEPPWSYAPELVHTEAPAPPLSELAPIIEEVD